MPFVQVQTASGIANYHYIISTPTYSSARWIDEKLPTLLFLHGVWLAQEVFHLQFMDPQVRRFNLVALDLRFFGKTTGPPLPRTYEKEDAANDVSKFMDALNLPPCHVVGLSLGSTIALQLAISHPTKVRSLFLMSALILEEPLEVAEGREEVCQYWMESYTDEDALLVATYGGYQLACSNKASPLIDALTKNLTPTARRNWGPDHFEEYKLATVDFITKRRSPSLEELSKIQCPIELVHGMDNMAYSLEYCEKQLKLLQEAGIDASLFTIEDAPHFISLKKAVNPLLAEFILNNSKEDVESVAEDGISSPWHSVLGDVFGEELDEDVFECIVAG